MRIERIQIERWRGFENVTIEANAPVVCIVGGNGSGKSHLLELISACAFRLGLTPNVNEPRGDPFWGEHQFSLTFRVERDVSKALDSPEQGLEHILSSWNRTLTIRSERQAEGADHKFRITAHLEDGTEDEKLARRITGLLNDSREVHFLWLDANRAYPKRANFIQDVAAAHDEQWLREEQRRGSAAQNTQSLYDEWIKFVIATEHQHSEQSKLFERTNQEYERSDPFSSYRSALQGVLPHLNFAGIDTITRKSLIFQIGKSQTSFDRLSGGEREIAFLIGQVERFGLKNGLFLIDEPELHLNPDLIRTWIGYLTKAIGIGQVWLATHSLEAIETVGAAASILLEVDPGSRRTNRVSRLSDSPAHAALARSIGTPAFSISREAFIYIEGTEAIGEQARFQRLAGSPDKIRFLPGGGSSEVMRRAGDLRLVSRESGVMIKVGAILDRDFKDTELIRALRQQAVHVLGVHEVENFLLDPPTLSVILQNNGRTSLKAEEIIREVADVRCGHWVLQWARARKPNASWANIEVDKLSRALASLHYDAFAGDVEAGTARWAHDSGLGESPAAEFMATLRIGFCAYKRIRVLPEFWMRCEGKQAIGRVAVNVGFTSAETLAGAVDAAWRKDESLLPHGVVELRRYCASLLAD